MRAFHLFAISALVLVAGCHSPVIDATLTNATAEPLSLLEVDYPSASFGVQNLAPGNSFHYRFKVLGSGPLKLAWTDSHRQDHASIGPTLKEGTEGSIAIAISPGAKVTWRPAFLPAH